MNNSKILVAAALLAAVFALGLLIDRGLTQLLDLQISLALSLRSGVDQVWLIKTMQAISWIGGGSQRSLIVFLLALALWRWRDVGTGLAMALTSLTSTWASEWLKLDFARSRPQLVPHLDDIGASLSYPSGHAANAAVVYLLLALVLPPQRRNLWLALAFTLSFLTGLSRIMLGVHYASDVLGGWMLGAAFALIGLDLAQRWQARVATSSAAVSKS